MKNVLTSVASNAPIIKAASQNGNLRMIAVQGEGFDLLDQHPELQNAGIYACVGQHNQLYVGYGVNAIARAYRITHAPQRPPLLVFIVGNDQPLGAEPAAALERIAHQAFVAGGHGFFNRDEPLGAPIDLASYTQIQRDWASLMPSLSRIVPALACPWVEPSHARLPEPHPDDAYHEQFFVAQKRGGPRAVLKQITGGYLILPGSLVRFEPIKSAGDLCHIVRTECRYAGLLVPEGDLLRLTRPVFRRTLCGCSRFVFTTGETAIWHRVNDQLPPAAA